MNVFWNHNNSNRKRGEHTWSMLPLWNNLLSNWWTRLLNRVSNSFRMIHSICFFFSNSFSYEHANWQTKNLKSDWKQKELKWTYSNVIEFQFIVGMFQKQKEKFFKKRTILFKMPIFWEGNLKLPFWKVLRLKWLWWFHFERDRDMIRIEFRIQVKIILLFYVCKFFIHSFLF